jgi:hypothetical protein
MYAMNRVTGLPIPIPIPPPPLIAWRLASLR